VTIKTADHFSGQWMSRTEIVQLVESTSGLERRMADLALLLMEMRTDIALASAGRITVEHIGTFSFYQSSSPQYEHCDPTRQYEKLLDTCLSGMLVGSRGVFWSRLFSLAPTHLRVLRDVLELLPAFRALTRYEIELSDEMRISPSTSRAVLGDASENWAEP
jgi:hypothetical protein